MAQKLYCLLCDYINPLSDKSSELVLDGALVFASRMESGRFVYCGKASGLPQFKNHHIEIIDKRGHLVLPGFFDMHFHWVQDDVRLKPKANLLKWLEKYTWPYEKKFKDKVYAKKRAERFAQELAQVGTIGGAVYASVHHHTVDFALKLFQGHFVVGDVIMTMNSPEYLKQSEAHARKQITSLSKKYKGQYCLTPRFAPTTDPQTMKVAGKLSRENGSWIQTHLSETPNECDYVLGLYRQLKGFEKVKDYTEIYEKVGLVTNKAIYGHGIHLSDRELKALARKKSLVAHCPTSNAPVSQNGLGSGLFNFKKAQAYKVKWALGSDIGGGPYLSMIDVMNSFVKQNRKAKVKGATYKKALYHSTLAGAEFFKLQKSCGNLIKGKEANFLVLGKFKRQINDNAESILERVLTRYPRSKSHLHIQQTYFQGKEIYSI